MKHVNLALTSVLFIAIVSGAPAPSARARSSGLASPRFSRVYGQAGGAVSAIGILRGANGDGYLVYGQSDVLRLSEDARTIYWQRRYGTGDPDALEGFSVQRIDPARGETYLMTRDRFVISTTAPFYTTYPHLVRIGETGFTAWNTNLEPRLASEALIPASAHASAEPSPGAVIVAGEGDSDASPYDVPWLQRIGPTGYISRTILMDAVGTNRFIVNEDGAFLMTAIPLSGTTPTPHNYRIAKFSVTGAPVWAKSFSIRGAQAYRFEALRRLGDGDLLVRAGGEDDDRLSHHILLLRFSPTGALRWQRVYRLPLTQTATTWQARKATDFVEGADGRIMIAGNTLQYSGTISSTTGVKTLAPWLMQLDADGDLRWFRSYTPTGDAAITFNGIVTQTGGYVLAGAHTPAGGADAIWLLGVDESGDAGIACASSSAASISALEVSISLSNTTVPTRTGGNPSLTGYDDIGRPVTNTLLSECDGTRPPATPTATPVPASPTPTLTLTASPAPASPTPTLTPEASSPQRLYVPVIVRQD